MSNAPTFMNRLKSDEITVMGVVNVTPDSFSDGGHFYSADKAIEHGVQLLAQGAHVLDIGGESTRPGAQGVDVEEEIARVVPVIEGLRDKAEWISIDTRNAKTMEAALNVGANIINDISALIHNPESVRVAAAAKVPVILMHMLGSPQDMQKNPSYSNVISEISQYLQERINYCTTHRIDKDLLVLDPGIGFGKTVEDNLLILRNIKEFMGLNCPILLGTSRKSFIGKISGEEDANKRLGGSLSSVLWGLSQGVKFFRVHDVAETIQAIKIYQAILETASES